MFVKSVSALLASAVLWAAPNCTFAQVSVAERLATGQPQVIVAAGRALDTGYPDDSLARFQWAIDRGVDALIVSVQLTGDGQHIVLYDGTLTRTTNVRDIHPSGAPSRDPGDAVAGWHLVADYTLEEIRRLRLIDPQGGDHPVPTLNEALDLIDGRVLTVLSLAGFEMESLVAQLAARDTRHLLLFSEGDLPKLQALSAATGIGVWSTLSEARDPMAFLRERVEYFGADLKVVDVEYDQLTPDLVTLADQLGVWLCHRGVGMEDIALKGGNSEPWLGALDGPAKVFLTRYPEAVLELLDR